MKKLYLGLTFLLSGAFAIGQTYVSTKDFQDQMITSQGWTSYVSTSNPGSYDWTTQDLGSPGNYYGYASGWNGSGADSADLWLISPSFDLTTATSPTLVFNSATDFTGPGMEVYVSTNYDGSSDPTVQGTWDNITSMATLSAGGFTWTGSGNVDLSAYNTNNSCYVAFRYQSDATNGAAAWEVDEIIVSEPIVPSTVSIFDIQNSTGDSPYKDSIVMTGGIVTGFNTNGYAIQSGSGPFTGVWVEDATNAAGVNRGDSVTLTGTVEEFFNFTRINNVTNFNTVSTGNAEPAPTVVSTTGANSEDWEGTLVEITWSLCVDDNLGANFGMYIISDGTLNLFVDDELWVTTPAPVLNNEYWIVGIGWYSFSEFKIQPRDVNDVINITSIEENEANFSFYPNPVVDQISLNSEWPINNVEILTVDGQLVRSFNVTTGNARLDVADLANGTYVLKVLTDKGIAVQRFVK